MIPSQHCSITQLEAVLKRFAIFKRCWKKLFASMFFTLEKKSKLDITFSWTRVNQAFGKAMLKNVSKGEKRWK